MRGKGLLAVILLGVFLTVSFMAATAEEEAYTLVGTKNCKMCHNKAKTGAQFAVWEKGPHAGAYATLATDAAKAAGKELGIDDPQTSDKCLPCHTTAFPVMADLENQKIVPEDGVSCESCHGPGSGYKSLKVMKAITAGETDGATVGLWVPDEKVCVTCHKEEGNPTFKGFDFAEYVKKVAHPIPSE